MAAEIDGWDSPNYCGEARIHSHLAFVIGAFSSSTRGKLVPVQDVFLSLAFVAKIKGRMQRQKLF